MNSKISQPFIQLDRIEELIRLEPALLILGLAASAWMIYKAALRGVNEERHENLGNLFRNLLFHLTSMLACLGIHLFLHTLNTTPLLERLETYFGIGAVFFGANVIIRASRILLFEYLFFSHMKEGVPVLLVNLFSLLLSMLVYGFLISKIFDIRLAPLLATSAAFSLVLGLALQETLGNLFSGAALQMDKPYGIGDWIEVVNGPVKWTGQVHEISWRATVLVGLSDEYVTIPNRIMGQASISNFAAKNQPIIRSQLVKIPYHVNRAKVKSVLLSSTLQCKGVLKDPAPLILVGELHESWVQYKIVYFIDDYGHQGLIADEVFESALFALDKEKIEVALNRVQIQNLAAY